MKNIFLPLTLYCLAVLPAALAAPSKLKGSTKKTFAVRPQGQRQLAKKSGPTHRECKYSTKASSRSQQVKFSCKARAVRDVFSEEEAMSRGISLQPDEGIRDKIQYKVKTDQKGIKVKVEYKQKYLDGTVDDEDITDVATQFEVNFDRIVEYAKPASANDVGEEEELSDDAQAYDWDNDTILQTVELTEWQEFTTVLDDDDGILSYFSVTSVDGMALFNFTISRADIGEKANANTMKIDVLITDFPWMRNDTNLALMSTVNSKLKVKMDYNDEAGVDAQQYIGKKAKWAREVHIAFDEATEDIGFVPTGEYKWQDLAEATLNAAMSNITLVPNNECQNQTVLEGRSAELLPQCVNVTVSEEVEAKKDTIRVVATSPPQSGNETFQVIAYSFVGSAAQGASEIYWDPEAGIGYSAAMGSALSSLLNIVSALAVSGMLLLAF